MGAPGVHACVVVTIDQSPAGLIGLFHDLGRELSSHQRRLEAVTAVTELAVRRVPGTDWASVSEGSGGTFTTTAATHEEARAVDQIQYELDTGPCVDAILQDTVFRTDDLRTDRRWPTFAERATRTSATRSMLSFRLFLEGDDRIAGLNLYSTRTGAFDEGSEVVGTLMATHGALAVQAAAAREQAAQLQRALLTSRDIGTAMGVLMAQHKVTRTEAFDLLRVASQTSNRKLADIAADVADTGTLDLPGRWLDPRRASRNGR